MFINEIGEFLDAISDVYFPYNRKGNCVATVDQSVDYPIMIRWSYDPLSKKYFDDREKARINAERLAKEGKIRIAGKIPSMIGGEPYNEDIHTDLLMYDNVVVEYVSGTLKSYDWKFISRIIEAKSSFDFASNEYCEVLSFISSIKIITEILNINTLR